MRFKNREEAARLLAERLDGYRGQDPLVLGVPRGAVPMARIIAGALGGEVDAVLVRKLRAPGQPELAIGAVDEAGTVVKGEYFDLVPQQYVSEEVRTEQEILRRRRRLYSQSRAAIDPAGRVVIVVDDGIATGASMVSAVRAVKARHPKKIVVAIGVAPPASLRAVARDADEVVCLHSTTDFYAVGEFFDDFREVTDEMVVEALASGHAPFKSSEVPHVRR